MRSKWKIVNLGKYISQQSIRNRGLENIEVYSVTNSDGFTKSTDYFSKEVFSKNLSNYKLVTRKQFAYNPSRINVGSIACLSDTDFALVSPLYIIFEVDKEYLFPDYLLRYLKSHYGNVQIRNNTQGSVRDSLKYEGLEKIQIPLPPLNDQIRIIAVLTRMEALIAKRKESIRALDELLKSTFLELFGDPVQNEKGWEIVTLKDLCSKVIDCPHNTPQYSDELTGLYCIRSADIQNGYLDLNTTLQVDVDTFNQRNARHIPSYNDIVFTREGGRLGNSARIPQDVNICLGQRIMLFTVDCNIATSEFLWASLNTSSIQQCINNLVGGGAAPRVNIKDLINIKCCRPPLPLQNQFAAIVEKVELLKLKYTQSLADLENLYGSLVQRAIKGELDLSKVPVEKESHVTELHEEEMVTASIENELFVPPICSAVELLKIIRSLSGKAFSFGSLIIELEKASFEEMPKYEELKKQIYKMLEGANPLLSQTFDKVNKEIVLRANI